MLSRVRVDGNGNGNLSFRNNLAYVTQEKSGFKFFLRPFAEPAPHSDWGS
jgi:hypothetical protein